MMNAHERKHAADVIVIRLATADDIAIINEFFDAMGGESRALFNRDDQQRRWALEYCATKNPAWRYWLAILDGKMVGFVFMNEWNTMIPILGIGVRDDLKGMHLGSRLMDHAIASAKQAGKGGIRLTTHFANLRGQRLYEKKGFLRVGQYANVIEVFYLLCFEDPKA